MIELTRLNGHTLTLNCELVKHAEAAPDTVITLVTGEKFIVLETTAEVARRILHYRTLVLRSAFPDAAGFVSARLAHQAARLTVLAREQNREPANAQPTARR